jgi:amidase
MLHNVGCEILEIASPDDLGREVHGLIGQILSWRWRPGSTRWACRTTRSARSPPPTGRGGGPSRGGGLRDNQPVRGAVGRHDARALLRTATWCWRRSCRARRRRSGSFPTDHGDIDAHLAKMEAMAPNAALANLAGLPALAIPTGMVEGCPWACS